MSHMDELKNISFYRYDSCLRINAPLTVFQGQHLVIFLNYYVEEGQI